MATIEIDDEVYDALSFGKARALADLCKREFHDLLGERGIPRHYTEAELAEDLEYAE